MDAYLTLQTYNANLFLVGVPPQTGPRNVDVPANNRKMLAAFMEAAIAPIVTAIDALQDGTSGVRASIMGGAKPTGD